MGEVVALHTQRLTEPASTTEVIEEVSSMLSSLTNFVGVPSQSYELMNTEHEGGLPTLMGGIDSRFITEPTYVPSIGGVFIQERLAMSAGWHVAATDLDPEREGEAKLLKFVTIEDTPEANPDAFEAQIRDLYLQLTGLPLAPDAKEPAELMQLWKYQYSIEADPTRAWASVVTAVLRDPTVIFY